MSRLPNSHVTTHPPTHPPKTSADSDPCAPLLFAVTKCDDESKLQGICEEFLRFPETPGRIFTFEGLCSSTAFALLMQGLYTSASSWDRGVRKRGVCCPMSKSE